MCLRRMERVFELFGTFRKPLQCRFVGPWCSAGDYYETIKKTILFQEGKTRKQYSKEKLITSLGRRMRDVKKGGVHVLSMRLGRNGRLKNWHWRCRTQEVCLGVCKYFAVARKLHCKLLNKA